MIVWSHTIRTVFIQPHNDNADIHFSDYIENMIVVVKQMNGHHETLQRRKYLL